MSEGGLAAQLQQKFADALKTKPSAEAPSSSPQYKQKPWLQNTFLMGGQSAIVGAIFAGLRNSLSGKSVGLLRPIGIFTAVGAAFALTESVVANQRQTDDAINSASGACAAGFLLGIGTRSLPMAIGTCSIMGGLAGMHKYTNGMGPRNPKPDTGKSFFKPTAVVEAAKHE